MPQVSALDFVKKTLIIKPDNNIDSKNHFLMKLMHSCATCLRGKYAEEKKKEEEIRFPLHTAYMRQKGDPLVFIASKKPIFILFISRWLLDNFTNLCFLCSPPTFKRLESILQSCQVYRSSSASSTCKIECLWFVYHLNIRPIMLLFAVNEEFFLNES